MITIVVLLVSIVCAADPTPSFEEDPWFDRLQDDDGDGFLLLRFMPSVPKVYCLEPGFDDRVRPSARLGRQALYQAHDLCKQGRAAEARARFVDAVELWRDIESPPRDLLRIALMNIRHLDWLVAVDARDAELARLDAIEFMKGCGLDPAGPRPKAGDTCRSRIIPDVPGVLEAPVPSRAIFNQVFCEKPYLHEAELARGDPGAVAFERGLVHCRGVGAADSENAIAAFKDAASWWAATRIVEEVEGFAVALNNIEHLEKGAIEEASSRHIDESNRASYVARCGLDPAAPLPPRCTIVTPAR